MAVGRVKDGHVVVGLQGRHEGLQFRPVPRQADVHVGQRCIMLLAQTAPQQQGSRTRKNMSFIHRQITCASKRVHIQILKLTKKQNKKTLTPPHPPSPPHTHTPTHTHTHAHSLTYIHTLPKLHLLLFRHTFLLCVCFVCRWRALYLTGRNKELGTKTGEKNQNTTDIHSNFFFTVQSIVPVFKG